MLAADFSQAIIVPYVTVLFNFVLTHCITIIYSLVKLRCLPREPVTIRQFLRNGPENFAVTTANKHVAESLLPSHSCSFLAHPHFLPGSVRFSFSRMLLSQLGQTPHRHKNRQGQKQHDDSHDDGQNRLDERRKILNGVVDLHVVMLGDIDKHVI